jgi:hypothetical protein
MEIAVGICTKFPTLYNKIFGDSHARITDYESGAAEILATICELEPVIGKVLELYYK